MKIGLLAWSTIVAWFLFFLTASLFLPRFLAVEEYSLSYPYALGYRVGSIFYLIPIYLVFASPKEWVKKRLLLFVLIWLVMGFVLAETYSHSRNMRASLWDPSLWAALHVSYALLVPALLAGSSLLVYALSIKPLKSRLFASAAGFLLGLFLPSTFSFVLGGTDDGPIMMGFFMGLLLGPVLAIIAGLYPWSRGNSLEKGNVE